MGTVIAVLPMLGEQHFIFIPGEKTRGDESSTCLQHGLQDHGVALHNLAQRNELGVGAQEIQRSAACSSTRFPSRLHQASRSASSVQPDTKVPYGLCSALDVDGALLSFPRDG